MNLSPEERQIGQENFFRTLGVTRRDLLKAAAVAPAVGAFYFGYSQLDGNPVRAALIGCGDQGNVLLNDSNPEYVQFIAYCDIRPSQAERVKVGDPKSSQRSGFLWKYDLNEQQFQQQVRFYDDYQRLLQDPDIELVVIALPSHLHHAVVMDALAAGKHVFCESPMALDVAHCKEMARKSRETERYLAVGHQRHYSILYDNTQSLIRNDLLGSVHHIRAFWHRNDSWPRMENNRPVKVDGVIQLDDRWRPAIPDADRSLDAGLLSGHGYGSVEELCWWRLFRRSGGGLMPEFGSQQLDACSVLLDNVQPLAVQGVGGKYFFDDERDVEDHVYATFEFPGPTHPLGKKQGNVDHDIVVVTYSSICTNAGEQYGEQIMGSRGTMYVESERDVMLYREVSPGNNVLAYATEVTVSPQDSDQPVLETSESSAMGTASSGVAQSSLAGGPSPGFREQLEHLAWCIRNPDLENQPRCGPELALSRAVVALTANLAMVDHRRIEFRPEWFDVDSDEIPN